MSSISSHEGSNAEDLDDLDNLVDGHAVEEDSADQEVPEHQGNQDDEAEEAAPAAANSKPKRIIKNPQPKLNVETLKGSRGIHTLPQVFEKVKFKGKGYEEQDLNLLMKTYEYWCHRLFPKFSFDDCLARIEKLGTKKTVQTHIKKIRMDLLVDETIRVQSDNEEADDFNEVERAADEPIQLTEDQLERIRLNKEKALKRLQDAKNAASNNLPSSQINLESNNRRDSHESTENQPLAQNIIATHVKNDTGINELSENVELCEEIISHEFDTEEISKSQDNQERNEAKSPNAEEKNLEEDELEAMEINEETEPANENCTPQENSDLVNQHEVQSMDEDEEMDIESMLDVIAKGP